MNALIVTVTPAIPNENCVNADKKARKLAEEIVPSGSKYAVHTNARDMTEIKVMRRMSVRIS